MKQYFVYQHISPSNKSYIGITCQVNYKHRWNNGKGYSDNSYFTNAVNKYGWNNFQHIILYENLTEEEAKRMEIKLIDELQTTDRNKGYNITNGGESTNGLHHSEETKKRISNKLKGLKKSEETKYKIGISNKGKVITEETKRKISESKKGTIPWNKGIKYTDIVLDNHHKGHCKAVLVYLYSTGEFYKRFSSRRECAKFFNCSETTVGDCLTGRTKSFNKKQYIARYE